MRKDFGFIFQMTLNGLDFREKKTFLSSFFPSLLCQKFISKNWKHRKIKEPSFKEAIKEIIFHPQKRDHLIFMTLLIKNFFYMLKIYNGRKWGTITQEKRNKTKIYIILLNWNKKNKKSFIMKIRFIASTNGWWILN